MDGKNSFADEVAVRMTSKFIESCAKGENPPIPNLGEENKSSDFQNQLIDSLIFVLKQIDLDMFEKLRNGELTLHQVVARIHLFQTGRTVAVLDDMRADLHPSLLVKPSRYV